MKTLIAIFLCLWATAVLASPGPDDTDIDVVTDGPYVFATPNIQEQILVFRKWFKVDFEFEKQGYKGVKSVRIKCNSATKTFKMEQKIYPAWRGNIIEAVLKKNYASAIFPVTDNPDVWGFNRQLIVVCEKTKIRLTTVFLPNATSVINTPRSQDGSRGSADP